MNPVRQDVLDAASPFIGGTVLTLTAMTCSALTAGVMALGVSLGELERSRLRVLRMIGTMAVGGNAFANDLNKFNRAMNLGVSRCQAIAQQVAVEVDRMIGSEA